MIGLLRGQLIEKHPNLAIVDVQGVGYEVVIPVSTFTRLPDIGAAVTLRVHTHVREDAIALFGFLTLEEKTIFERLIAVNGVGPKLAVTILSGLPAAELIAAIRSSDVARLTRVPGIGKKTAERLVVELRDKLEAVATETAAPAAAAVASWSQVEEDVLSALVNLGCPRPAAESALRKARALGVEAGFEPLFRRSLELVR